MLFFDLTLDAPAENLALDEALLLEGEDTPKPREVLRLWEPRGHEYWPIHGSELFEMALERNPVSLRINPDGDVGGELYAHEVEMLVRAVQTFRSRQN